MLIKNLTSKKQKLVVRELTGEHREYDIFVNPGSSTDLDRRLVVNPEKYAGIFDFGGVDPIPVAPVVEEKKEEIPQVVEEIKPTEEPEAVVEENSEAEPEAFICDVCGAEFASARGLASHKNKAHAE